MLIEAVLLAIVLADRRCAGAGGGDRSPGSFARPSGAQRGERAQRWHLRAAFADRDRDAEAEEGAIGDGARCTSCSRRSATAASGASLRDSQPQQSSGWACRAASSIHLDPGRPGRGGRAVRAGRVDGRQRVIAAFIGGAVFGGLRREVGGEATSSSKRRAAAGAVTFILAVMLVRCSMTSPQTSFCMRF